MELPTDIRDVAVIISHVRLVNSRSYSYSNERVAIRDSESKEEPKR